LTPWKKGKSASKPLTSTEESSSADTLKKGKQKKGLNGGYSVSGYATEAGKTSGKVDKKLKVEGEARESFQRLSLERIDHLHPKNMKEG